MAPRGCLGVWRGDRLIQRERTWGLLRIPGGPGDNEFRNHGTCGRKAFGTSWFSLLPAEPEVSLAASLSARPGGEPGQRGPQASDLPPAIPAAFCGLSYRTDGWTGLGRTGSSLLDHHAQGEEAEPPFPGQPVGEHLPGLCPPALVGGHRLRAGLEDAGSPGGHRGQLPRPAGPSHPSCPWA